MTIVAFLNHAAQVHASCWPIPSNQGSQAAYCDDAVSPMSLRRLRNREKVCRLRHGEQRMKHDWLHISHRLVESFVHEIDTLLSLSDTFRKQVNVLRRHGQELL